MNPSTVQPFLRDVRRALSWHRRKLAVIAAAAAMVAGINAANPPDPPSMVVARARHHLTVGTTLTDGDVEMTRLPVAALPQDAVTEETAIVGERLTGDVSAGQVLTATSLAPQRGRAGPNRVIAPVRLADPAVAALLVPGESVDLVAADPQGGKPTVIATGVRIMSIPPPDEEGSPHSLGVSGTLVLVEVDRARAPLVAQAGATHHLSVTLE